MDVLSALNIDTAGTVGLSSINPATEEIIAVVSEHDKKFYDSMLLQAVSASEHWAVVPAPKRAEMIRDIAEQLRKKQEALGELISMETGKLKSEGIGEVQEMLDMADFAIGQSRMLYGKTMHSERKQHRMYEQWHPLGVVGVITAFNFPAAVWAWNAFNAVICGNAVVWKPSPKTPLTAVAIHTLCETVARQHGQDSLFSLMITRDLNLVNQLLDDERLSLISFTGSTAVGRQVAERVARRLGRSLLELSGNNALIIDESADLNLAIPAVLFGLVGTTGQRCTSTRRLFVHQSRLEEVRGALLHALKQIIVGDPLDAQTTMGPLIDQAAVDVYWQVLNDIQQLGGEVLFGGKALDKKGYFVTPTLVAAQHDWPIVHKETFAPILYLLPYENLSEVLKQHNAVPQGLSSSLFSNNVQHVEQFLSAQGSDCGIANINVGTSGAEIGGAFGGEKATGGGREAGSDAWKNYMRCQTVTINWSDELPLAQGIDFQV